MLDIVQLQYYKQVVDSRNVQIAAEKLFISRQALAKQLHHMEEEMGVALIEVNHGVVSTTMAGKSFYDECTKLLSAYSRFQHNVNGLKNNPLSIGYAYGVRIVLDVNTLTNFQSVNPEVKLELTENNTDEIINSVEHEGVELGVIGTCTSFIEDYEYQRLVSTPIYVQVPEEYVTKDKNYLTLNDLSEIPLVTAGRHNHLSQFLDDECDRLNIALNVAFSATSVDLILNYALQERTAFLSFNPRISPAIPGYKSMPVYFDVNPHFGVYLIRKKNVSHSKNCELLWDYLSEREQKAN